MNPSFADLRLVTSASSCSDLNFSFDSGVTCDPWDRPFNYPYLWIELFRFFRISEEYTDSLGTLMIILFGVTLHYWLIKAYRFAKFNQSFVILFVLTTILMFSPPVLLLIERGNTDILIFALLTYSFQLYSRNLFIISAIVFALCVALKVYPFFLLVFFLTLKGVKTRALYATAGFLALLISVPDLVMIGKRSWVGWNTGMFGLSGLPDLFLDYFFATENYAMSMFLGVTLLFLICLLIQFSSKHLRNGILMNQVSKPNQLGLMMHFWGIFGVSVFLMPSYDLRLPLYIPLFTMLLLSQHSLGRALILAVLVIVSYYCTYRVSTMTLNVLGDIALFILIALSVLKIYREVFDQVMVSIAGLRNRAQY